MKERTKGNKKEKKKNNLRGKRKIKRLLSIEAREKYDRRG